MIMNVIFMSINLFLIFYRNLFFSPSKENNFIKKVKEHLIIFLNSLFNFSYKLIIFLYVQSCYQIEFNLELLIKKSGMTLSVQNKKKKNKR